MAVFERPARHRSRSGEGGRRYLRNDSRGFRSGHMHRSLWISPWENWHDREVNIGSRLNSAIFCDTLERY